MGHPSVDIRSTTALGSPVERSFRGFVQFGSDPSKRTDRLEIPDGWQGTAGSRDDRRRCSYRRRRPLLRHRRNRTQPSGIGRNGEAAVRRCQGGGRRRRQAPEARQPLALHARFLRAALRQREQLRRDLWQSPRGARDGRRRVPRAPGLRRRARDRLLLDRVRPPERRFPRGDRRARLQGRLGRHPQRPAAAPPRPDRQADHPLDRRRPAGRCRARLRDRQRRLGQRRHPPVHGRLPGRLGRARSARDPDLPGELPRGP